MVSAAIEILSLQILVVCNYQVRNVKRYLRTCIYQIFLQLLCVLQTFCLIFLCCNLINQLIRFSIRIVMVVGAGTGIEQITVYEIYLFTTGALFAGIFKIN